MSMSSKYEQAAGTFDRDLYLDCHEAPIVALAFSPVYPHLLASCSMDRTVVVSSLDTRDKVHTFSDFTSNARPEHVVWSPIDAMLFVAAADQTIRCYDALAGKLLNQMENAQMGAMGRPAVHPSGSFLVVPYPERRELVVVNTNSMTPSFTFPVPSQPTSLCFSAALPDTLHVGCSDGHVRTFTISTSADQIHDFSVGPSTVSILSQTATNAYLVVSSSDGFVTLWDSRQFTCVQSIAADRSEPALQSVITADERWIVTRTEDANAVEIAHSRFGAVVMRSECPFTIMALAMHATQPAFAVAGNMREVGGGGTRSRKAGLMLYSILVKGYRPTK